MIKLYKIKIGEKVYEVELEEVTEKEGRIEDSEKKADEKKEASKTEGVTKVEAPMQGLVLNILISLGEKVKAGQDLIILEAMKMENEIVAPKDGTVSQVLVSKGSSVDTDEVLAVIA